MTRFYSLLNEGLYPTLVGFEFTSYFQIPSFVIVGLPSREIQESKERVRAAMEASGFEFPKRRVVVSLTPSGVPKAGSCLDLPIALGLLCEDHSNLKMGAWGELSLDGSIREAEQLGRFLYSCASGNLDRIIIPASCLEKVKEISEELSGYFQSLTKIPQVALVRNLCEARSAACDTQTPYPLLSSFGGHRKIVTDPIEKIPLPISDYLARWIGISAAGHHHLMLLGPRGAGKTQALSWLEFILPKGDLEAKVINTLMGEMSSASPSVIGIRRVSPKISSAALCGTFLSQGFRPGEFSLAHGGALFADEFPEWPRDAREALREPLESGTITVSRRSGSIVLPGKFLFAATGNLCPCGGVPGDLDDHEESAPCVCTAVAKRAYQSRISGPISDRIDIILRVTSDSTKPRTPPRCVKEFAYSLKKRVELVRAASIERFGGPAGALPARDLEALIERNGIRAQIEQLEGLKDSKGNDSTGSLRDFHKIARVALTASLWDDEPAPAPEHIVQARFCRSLHRSFGSKNYLC